jgi:acyl carrier protein
LEAIDTRVKKVIAEQLGVAQADLKPDDKFIEDLGADSLDEMELIMALEDEFDLMIDDTDVETIKTVQQAVDFITSKVPA